MKTIFVVCIKKVPTRCFDTYREARAWVSKMINYGLESDCFKIHQTLYYF